MRIIDCGVSGTNRLPDTHKLSEINVREEIKKAFLSYYGRDLLLRPAQDAALFTDKILNNIQGFIRTSIVHNDTLPICIGLSTNGFESCSN